MLAVTRNNATSGFRSAVYPYKTNVVPGADLYQPVKQRPFAPFQKNQQESGIIFRLHSVSFKKTSSPSLSSSSSSSSHSVCELLSAPKVTSHSAKSHMSLNANGTLFILAVVLPTTELFCLLKNNHRKEYNEQG
jgi:hypothetical protein